MENQNKKKCSKCPELRDYNCFNNYYKGKNGLQCYCKECFHKYSCIEYRDKMIEHLKNEYYPKN